MEGGHLHLLGVVRCEGQGGEERLAGAQPRLVLVRTALERGRPVLDDELAEVLWPAGPARHWEGALRGIVVKVRAFLGALDNPSLAFENVGRSYRLTCPDNVSVDVWQAERSLRHAEASLADGVLHEAAVAADDVTALLGAPLLPGVDGEWLIPWRARLAGDRRRALRAAATAHMRLGRHDDAVERASLAVADDTYDEESHRTLMAAHLAAGNRAAALRSYGDCRRLLADELGVAPAEETEALYLELLAANAGTVTPVATGLPRGRHLLPALDHHRFVGRDQELTTLATAWDAARSGRRQVVLLHGEAGVGKTRLGLEAVRRNKPDRVLYGRSSPEQVVPFEPFAEAIDRHLTQVGDHEMAALVGSFGPELAGLVPVVADRAGIEPLSVAEGDNRPRVFEAVRSVLSRIATAPTILVIDDLQWAGPATLLLLRHVLRMLDGSRLLVVLTYRDDLEPHPALAEAITELHRLEGCQTVPVGGLEAAEVAALLRANGVEQADELGLALRERTGGNGFYLTQVLSATAEDPRSFDPFRVPDTVNELVRHRVATLSPAARDVLAVAAVLGTTLSADLLDRAVGVDAVHSDAVDELVERHLLLETDGGDYGFAHAIVRDVVYRQLPRGRRRRLHLRAARSIEEVGRGNPDLAASLSLHYFLAADPAHADAMIDASTRAAEHAMSVLAYEQAAKLYDRAARGIERFAPDDGRAAKIHLGLGAARRRAGDFSAALDALTTALDLARTSGQDAMFAEVVLELVAKGGRGVAVTMSDPDRADLLQEAVDRLDHTETALLVSLLAELALSLLLTDRFLRIHAVAERAQRIADESGRADLVARAVVAQRLLHPLPDGAAARLAHTDPIVLLPPAEVSSEQLVRLHMWRLTDCFELGDRPGVDRELMALRRLADELDQPYWHWIAGSWQALHTFLDGDVDGAEALALRAFDHVAALDHPETLVAYGLQHVGFRLVVGRGAEVLPIMGGVVAQMPDMTVMRCGLAFAHAQAGDHAEAAALVAALAADGFSALPRDGNWAIGLACLTETVYELGDAKTAAQIIPMLEPFRDRFVVVSGFGAGGGCWGPFSGLLGSLRWCVGDTVGAERDYDDALEALERFDAPILHQRLTARRARWRGRVPDRSG